MTRIVNGRHRREDLRKVNVWKEVDVDGVFDCVQSMSYRLDSEGIGEDSQAGGG